MSNKPLEVEVLPPAKPKLPAVVPKLNSGDDAAAGKQLTKLFSDAQNGMRKIVSLGLFAWEIKEEKLKHGEWGPWLAVNCPKLITIDTNTQKPKPSRALQGYMDLTKNVLEAAGIPTIEKYLDGPAKCANAAHLKPGAFLLLADKKVPDSLKEVREKICSIVDGKTQRQLFLEFKQADDDSDKPKRGRLKGSKGLTKEMREKAEQRAEQERLNELEEEIIERIDWLLEIADAKNLGMMEAKLRKKFSDACDTASGFCKRCNEAQKGGQA